MKAGFVLPGDRVFDPELGMPMRAHVALECLKAMLSNPETQKLHAHLVSRRMLRVSEAHEKMLDASFALADAFIDRSQW